MGGEGWQPGPGHPVSLGLSQGFSWSPGSLVASAQQPGPQLRGTGPSGKGLESEALGSGALQEGQPTGELSISNHLQLPPQSAAPVGAQRRDAAGHVLRGYLRPLASCLEKFVSAVSFPRGTPHLLSSCCTEDRDIGPRKPNPWMVSFFPRWSSRARSSQRIQVRAHEISDLIRSRLCFIAPPHPTWPSQDPVT